MTKPVRPVRTATDMTWQTPEWILMRERFYQRGQIQLDPATAADNPTKARRFCAGDGGPLFVENATKEHLTGLRYERLTSTVERFAPACPSCAHGGGPHCDGWLAVQSGLDVVWCGHEVWCNPPFGDDLKFWLVKFQEEARRGTSMRVLLPCNRFEQPYMQGALLAARAVCWIDAKKGKGYGARRVAFRSTIDGEEPGANPFASMVLAFNSDLERFREAYEPIGTCQRLLPMGPS